MFLFDILPYLDVSNYEVLINAKIKVFQKAPGADPRAGNPNIIILGTI